MRTMQNLEMLSHLKSRLKFAAKVLKMFSSFICFVTSKRPLLLIKHQNILNICKQLLSFHCAEELIA